MKPNAFLEAAAQGRNDWWRYALNTAWVLFATLFLGSLPLMAVAVWLLLDNDPATQLDATTGALLGVPPWLGLALTLGPFVAGLAALLGGVAVLHRRSPVTLVTPGRPIRWGRIAAAGAAWALLVAGMSVVEALLYPGRYAFTPNLPALIPYALVAVLLLPLQTSAEELLLRSYLMQGVGRLVRRPWVLAGLSGLVFGLLHGANPEVGVDFWPAMAFYVLFGVALAALTLRTESAELALGVHAGNNLFAALFSTFKGSALPSPALFTANAFSPWYNLIALAVGLAVFAWLFARRPAPPPVQAGAAVPESLTK
ncbi:MAG: CPBP family intramembrane metalloprotease [Anaerolineales bacterium]|nr:CPBP family intramembrane metalloprotease [Anaerolineales bacterium]